MCSVSIVGRGESEILYGARPICKKLLDRELHFGSFIIHRFATEGFETLCLSLLLLSATIVEMAHDARALAVFCMKQGCPTRCIYRSTVAILGVTGL